MKFADQTAMLSEDQRLHFYEILAHNLTTAVRGVWSDESLGNAEKVERMKRINEVLHRVTSKVWVLRLKTHDWTETDFGEMVSETAGRNPDVMGGVLGAINNSYRAVAGMDMG